jgi:hypothetical protein
MKRSARFELPFENGINWSGAQRFSILAFEWSAATGTETLNDFINWVREFSNECDRIEQLSQMSLNFISKNLSAFLFPK